MKYLVNDVYNDVCRSRPCLNDLELWKDPSKWIQNRLFHPKHKGSNFSRFHQTSRQLVALDFHFTSNIQGVNTRTSHAAFPTPSVLSLRRESFPARRVLCSPLEAYQSRFNINSSFTFVLLLIESLFTGKAYQLQTWSQAHTLQSRSDTGTFVSGKAHLSASRRVRPRGSSRPSSKRIHGGSRPGVCPTFTDVSESSGGQGFQLASLPTSPGDSRARGRTVAATLSLELFLFMQPRISGWMLPLTALTQDLEAIWSSKAPTDLSKAKLGAAPGCTKHINIHICLRGLEVPRWSFGLKSAWRKSMPVTFSTLVWTESTVSAIYGVSGKGPGDGGQGMRAPSPPSSQHADGKDWALPLLRMQWAPWTLWPQSLSFLLLLLLLLWHTQQKFISHSADCWKFKMKVSLVFFCFVFSFWI